LHWNGFVVDSPLEQAGFEISVPLKMEPASWAHTRLARWVLPGAWQLEVGMIVISTDR
jgi:hypothetical protein